MELNIKRKVKKENSAKKSNEDQGVNWWTVSLLVPYQNDIWLPRSPSKIAAEFLFLASNGNGFGWRADLYLHLHVYVEDTHSGFYTTRELIWSSRLTWRTLYVLQLVLMSRHSLGACTIWVLRLVVQRTLNCSLEIINNYCFQSF